MRSSQYTFSLLSYSCCSISWHSMFKRCLEERLGFLQNPFLSISLKIRVRNRNKALTSQYACRLSMTIQRTLKVINTVLNSHCATRQPWDFQHTLNITMNVVLSVVLAQVLFHVSRILKLYVNFSKFWFVSRFNLYVIACINSTELTNEFTTEDDRWTIETCLVLNLKLLSIS